MRLVIVRHAKADKRELFAATGRDDSERPLTDRGRKQARRTGRALARLVPHLDILATSPLVRAHETATRLARAYDAMPVQELPVLAPGAAVGDIVTWAAEQPADATIALVGHAPDLDRLAGWLLAGGDRPIFALKKGGACLVRFDAAPTAAAGTLAWLLTPRQLRRLAR